MTAKRWLLYNAYKTIRRSGYLNFINRNVNCATILMYHRVNDFDHDPLTTPTVVFDEMMQELKRCYEIISLQSLIGAIKEGRTLSSRVVIITFDDGYKDNIDSAAPILKQHNIPATFFVTTGYINTEIPFPWDKDSSTKNPLMTWDEVRQLDRMGFEIGAHTVTHADLGIVSLEEARREVRFAKQHIESELGKKVVSFAFPFGRRQSCNPAVSTIVKEEGYACCCSGYGGKVTERSDLFNLYRIPMYPSTIELLMEIDNFMTYFDGRMSINLLPSLIASHLQTAGKQERL